jgi:protein PhnA
MATGRDKHRAHQAAVAGLGRNLSRRARNQCELCETSKALKVVEIEPTFEDPDVERAILICESCQTALKGDISNPNTLRFLESVVWSTTPPVQVAAVRMLRTLSDNGATWATDCLDDLFLEPEIEALI